MFTGLIEEIGRVRQVVRGVIGRLEIEAQVVLEGTRAGDSIAVNGACLTVTALTDRSFTVDVIPETLRQTNLGALRPGSRANLERSVPVGGRLGGHLVQGHIDGTGQVVGKEHEGDAIWITVEPAPELMRYIVSRGFIAVDGASLTVARVESGHFAVSLIPHTQAQITLAQQATGYAANLEVDIVAKYVERLLHFGRSGEGGEAGPGIDRAYLERYGFI